MSARCYERPACKKQVDALQYPSLIWRVECFAGAAQPANSAGFVHLGAALKLRARQRSSVAGSTLAAMAVPVSTSSWASAAAISVRIARSCTITQLVLVPAIDAPARVADRGRRSAPLRRAVHVPVSGAGARSSTGIKRPCRLLVGDRIACARVSFLSEATGAAIPKAVAKVAPQGYWNYPKALSKRPPCAGNQYGAPDQAWEPPRRALIASRSAPSKVKCLHLEVVDIAGSPRIPKNVVCQPCIVNLKSGRPPYPFTKRTGKSMKSTVTQTTPRQC